MTVVVVYKTDHSMCEEVHKQFFIFKIFKIVCNVSSVTRTHLNQTKKPFLQKNVSNMTRTHVREKNMKNKELHSMGIENFYSS